MMSLCKGQKTIIRQFLILKNLGDVPDQVTLEHVEDLLLSVKRFRPVPHHALSRIMLEEMKMKVLTELEKEQRLSRQFGRKVTLEGLEMFLCMIRPLAEAEVRKLLLPLFSNLACSAGLDTNSKMESSPPAGDAGSPLKQVPTTSTLLQTVEKLVPVLVTATFNYLLEDREDQPCGSLFTSEQPSLTSVNGLWAKEAIADVFRLVEDVTISVFTTKCVSAMGSITHRVVKNMVVAIFQRFESALTSFRLIGHDSTEFDGRDATRSMISDIMDDMEMENMGTDVPEDLSNHMCEIATAAATPEVPMEDPLLETARALKNNNITVEDGLPEAAPEISAEARRPAVTMEDVLRELVVAHNDQARKAVITEVTSDQVQPSPRSPKTRTSSRFSEEALSLLLEVEAPKVEPELSDEKPSMVIGCVLATTSDLLHPMTGQVLEDVCRDMAEETRGVDQDIVKKHEKGSIRGFFRRVRKLFSCCCGLPTEEDETPPTWTV